MAEVRALTSDGRRQAFKANLGAHLDEALGDRLHPAFRARLVKTLADAHAGVRHGIELRGLVPTFSGWWYVVFQAGMAPWITRKEVGPLAAKVIRRAPDGVLDEFTPAERLTVLACVERAEITSKHPIDWRPRWSVRFARLYINLVAGKERRSQSLAVDVARRAPSGSRADQALSVLILLLAVAGVWAIGQALVDAYLVTPAIAEAPAR